MISVRTLGYGASLEDVKAAFRASLEGYRAWAVAREPTATPKV
jgi:hypothetical protein